MSVIENIKIGGHVSTAGGIFLAPERASKFGFKSFQIFSKNQMQWKAKPLDPKDVIRFVDSVQTMGFSGVMVHASYLLNMGTSDRDLQEKVVNAFANEIHRTDELGAEFLTFHPGSASGSTEEHSISLISENLNSLITREQKCIILLENAAGQGSTVGYSFEQLASIIDGLELKDKVGVCLDTCHVWAAGYDIVTPEGYQETMDRFQSTIGLKRLLGIHLNDSKKGKGSRVDRHEQIGKGTIGLAGISNIILDKRLAGVPMILETPLGEEGYAMDLEAIESISGRS